MDKTGDVNAAELTDSVVGFVRAFGLHRPDQTPCGQPVAVAEAHALMDLATFQPMSQRELTSRLRLQKSTVSRLVRQLERKGWVERGTGLHDRRLQEVRLTPQGKQIASSVARARRAKFEHILLRLPSGKRSRVVEALSLLAEASREQ